MASNSALDQGLTMEMKKNLFGNAYVNMVWHCKSDPRFHYVAHLPDAYMDEESPDYQLLVLPHATGNNAHIWVDAAREMADQNHLAILAPVFPGGLLDDDDFNSYKLLSDQGVRYDLALLAMVDEFGRRYPGVRTDKFFMFGHSGGGQFTNRFLLVHPERLKAVSIGAPGRPTFINFDEDYFWGVRDFRKYFDKDLDVAAVAKVPVYITVGELDNKYIGDSPYGNCRVDRMKSLKKNFEDYGVNVTMEILPGLEHADGMDVRTQKAIAFFQQYL